MTISFIKEVKKCQPNIIYTVIYKKPSNYNRPYTPKIFISFLKKFGLHVLAPAKLIARWGKMNKLWWLCTLNISNQRSNLQIF